MGRVVCCVLGALLYKSVIRACTFIVSAPVKNASLCIHNTLSNYFISDVVWGEALVGQLCLL